MSKSESTVSIDQAAKDFKDSVDLFVEKYKEKHKLNSKQYPLTLPTSNAGLWTEFMLDFYNNGTV